MTPLATLLRDRILATGPITLADYMAEALLHPIHGYYTTRDPLGAEGDFTTAPEISQMFGELIGLCLAQVWMDQGQPAPFTLAELGPGRGTLMADALRATTQVPGFHAAARVHLVEASPRLREEQAKRLPNPTWHDTPDTLPNAPLFLVANEFFDALPIRQFQRDGSGWREVQIGVTDGILTPGLTAPMPLRPLSHRVADTKDGDVVEQCPALPGLIAPVSERIAAHGGAALIIDYGGWRSLGDTIQAVQNHQPIDPFTTPGEADLTAHVDFEALAQSAPDCQFTPLINQGVFLERLGITPRARTLANGLDGDALTAHIAAHRRLTHPTEMGSLFKVMGLYPKECPAPPGLEP